MLLFRFVLMTYLAVFINVSIGYVSHPCLPSQYWSYLWRPHLSSSRSSSLGYHTGLLTNFLDGVIRYVSSPPMCFSSPFEYILIIICNVIYKMIIHFGFVLLIWSHWFMKRCHYYYFIIIVIIIIRKHRRRHHWYIIIIITIRHHHHHHN